MKPHAGRGLHERLDDDAGALVADLFEELGECPPAGVIDWQVARILLEQEPAEVPVHAVVWIADAHGAAGVAVVRMPQADESLSRRLAPIHPELHRHLHGHFDGHGAGVAEERMVEAAGHEPRQAVRQPHGLGMVDAPEHHVRQPMGLVHNRCDQVWVAMAVADGPPRGQGVDDPLAGVQLEPRSLGGDHMQRLAHRAHLAIGPPERHVGEMLGCPARVQSPTAVVRDGFVKGTHRAWSGA